MKKLIVWFLAFGVFLAGGVRADTASPVKEDAALKRSPKIAKGSLVNFSIELLESSRMWAEMYSLLISENGISYQMYITCQSSDLSLDFDFLFLELQANHLPLTSDDLAKGTEISIDNWTGKNIVIKQDEKTKEYFLLQNGVYVLAVGFECQDNQFLQADTRAKQLIKSLIIEYPKVQDCDDGVEITFDRNKELKMYVPSWLRFKDNLSSMLLWPEYSSIDKVRIMVFSIQNTMHVDRFLKDTSEAMNFDSDTSLYSTGQHDEWNILTLSDKKNYLSIANKNDNIIAVSAKSEEEFDDKVKEFLTNFWEETALLDKKQDK